MLEGGRIETAVQCPLDADGTCSSFGYGAKRSQKQCVDHIFSWAFTIFHFLFHIWPFSDIRMRLFNIFNLIQQSGTNCSIPNHVPFRHTNSSTLLSIDISVVCLSYIMGHPIVIYTFNLLCIAWGKYRVV